MNPVATYNAAEQLRQSLLVFGVPYEALLIVLSIVLAMVALVPRMRASRRMVLTLATLLLVAGEGGLAWFHWRLYGLAEVVSPDGVARAQVAVPLWVESEKLFVWALLVSVFALVMRRQRDEMLPGAMLLLSALILGAAVFGKPFSAPLPGFFGQYYGYLQGMAAGGQAAQGVYAGMESSRQFYYNAWYMWVHPPMLFISYAAFALSFVATVRMIASKHSSFETTAYRWARFGYIWLTFGMLLGLPWALQAWTGESWWWSGKVNMSLMMWFLYTAYLHARLYLRRRGMWKTVAALAVVSFLVLVLTYVTTYVVPGAHSYALTSPAQRAVALSAASGGES